MKVTAENIRSVDKGALRGFFDLVMEDFLRINSCSVFQKGDSWWIALPSKPYEAKDGTTKYQPIVEIPKERLEKLRDFVMPALKAELEKNYESKVDPNKAVRDMNEDVPF